MAIYQIHSIPIEIIVARRAVDLVSEAQITQLVQSLNRLPDEHLRRLPTITIKYFAEYAGGGSRLDRDEPENSFIRISHRCFQSSWNQPLTEPNQTLLHEVGHIIDWTYHINSLAMTKDEYVNHLKIFEGYATHMYLDTKGIVTIGIGIAFFSPTDAKKLMYMNRVTSKMATAEEIEADYKKVKAASPSFRSEFYKQFTKLDAVSTFLIGEFEKRLAEATTGAKAFYPAFDKLPSDVQYAIIDMAYNLGAGGLAKFKSLKKALEDGDYEKAAKESHRIGPGKDRNDKIAEWIRRGKLNTGDFSAPSSSTRFA